MSRKNRAVFGVYSNQQDAENAVNGLKLAGFRNTDVSILFQENAGTKDLVMTKGTKAPEGAATGASSGALVGGVIGWLVGAGMLAIPDLSVFVAAGPLVAALSGIGVGGVVGGLGGVLTGLAWPEYQAKRYQGRTRKGGILLSVHCDDSDWVKTASAILQQTGGEDISWTTEARADFGASDRPRSRVIEKQA